MSLAEKGHLVVCHKLTFHPRSHLATTAITVDEQLTGWYTLLRRAKTDVQIPDAYQRLVDTVSFPSKFTFLSFTLSAIHRFDDLKKKKLGVAGKDLRIAAIAIEHNAIVVTRNLRDFKRVAGLVVEDWSV
jgi:tRNA(fMet)-specific endonuclease VapC